MTAVRESIYTNADTCTQAMLDLAREARHRAYARGSMVVDAADFIDALLHPKATYYAGRVLHVLGVDRGYLQFQTAHWFARVPNETADERVGETQAAYDGWAIARTECQLRRRQLIPTTDVAYGMLKAGSVPVIKSLRRAGLTPDEAVAAIRTRGMLLS